METEIKTQHKANILKYYEKQIYGATDESCTLNNMSTASATMEAAKKAVSNGIVRIWAGYHHTGKGGPPGSEMYECSLDYTQSPVFLCVPPRTLR